MTDPDAPPASGSDPEPPPQFVHRLPPPESEAAAPEPPHAQPPHAEPPPAPAPYRGNALAWLGGIVLLLLAAGLAYVWWLTQQPHQAVVALQQRVAALEHRSSGATDQAADLQSLAGRVAALEHRPAPDIAGLQAQVAALQQRQPPDLAPLQAQIAALQHHQGADLTALQGRLAALEKQVGDLRQATASADQLADRLNALSTQVQAQGAREQTADNDLVHRLDATETRLAALEHSAAQVTQTAQRAARLARVEVAQSALAAGRPLGAIDGAPPPVAKFAATAPPTEAALRLSFPKAAQAALDAANPDTEGKPFLGQVLARAQDLITLRQGDHVLVGNPAAGILARAHAALDAGDVAGAANAVSSLTGPAAAAMASWLADAKALLDARAGLADMAAHA